MECTGMNIADFLASYEQLQLWWVCDVLLQLFEPYPFNISRNYSNFCTLALYGVYFYHTCSWYICEATASSRKRTYDRYNYFLSLTGLVKGMLPQNNNTNFSTSHASRMPYQHPLTFPCGTARSLHGYLAKVLRDNQPVLWRISWWHIMREGVDYELMNRLKMNYVNHLIPKDKTQNLRSWA